MTYGTPRFDVNITGVQVTYIKLLSGEIMIEKFDSIEEMEIDDDNDFDRVEVYLDYEIDLPCVVNQIDETVTITVEDSNVKSNF